VAKYVATFDLDETLDNFILVKVPQSIPYPAYYSTLSSQNFWSFFGNKNGVLHVRS